jgi:hypothetical protein
LSREVMGSALEDVQEREHGPRSDRAVRIDEPHAHPPRSGTATRPARPGSDPAATPDPAAGSAPGPAPAGGPLDALRRRGRPVLDGARRQVDVVRSSRLRTAAALGVAALVAGLVGAGVTAQVQQARLDRAAGVVAWLEYGNGYDGSERVSARLNVVNTGDRAVTVTEVDFEGGLEEGRSSGVSGELDDPLEVAPGDHASQTVLAEVQDCSQGQMSRGGSRDGQLRVRVSGTDLRGTWVDGARVGAFPISASTVVEMGCMADFARPVLVENTIVRPDGDLYVTLRSGTSDDVVVDLAGPDGVSLVTEPAMPIAIAGGQAASVTVGIGLQVDVCTVSAQQLDAGNQLRLVVGEDEFADLDYFVVNPWVVREVARACG